MSNKPFLNPWFDEAFSAPSGEAGPSSVDLYLNASPGSDMPAFGSPPRPSAFPDQGADPRAQTFMVPSPSVSTSSRPSFDTPRFGFNELFGNPDPSVNQNTAWSGIQEPPDDIRYRVGGFSRTDGMFGPPPVPGPAAGQPSMQSFLNPQAGAHFGVQDIQPSAEFFKLLSSPVFQGSQLRQTAPSFGDWSGGTGVMSPVPPSFAPSPAPMQAPGMWPFASQVAAFADPNLAAQTNSTLFGLPPYGNPSGPVGAPPAAPSSGFSSIPEYGRPVQPSGAAGATPDSPPETWRLARQLWDTYSLSNFPNRTSEPWVFDGEPDIFRPRPTVPAKAGPFSPYLRPANDADSYLQSLGGGISQSSQGNSYAGIPGGQKPEGVRRVGGYQNRARVYSKRFGDLAGSDSYVDDDVLESDSREGMSLEDKLKFTGGVMETAAGVGFGTLSGWTGVGAVTGAAIAAHGIDVAQSAWRGTDTYTSKGLQDAGVPRNVANGIDWGISGMSVVATGLPVLPYRMVTGRAALAGGGRGTSVITSTIRGYMPGIPALSKKFINDESPVVLRELSRRYGTGKVGPVIGRELTYGAGLVGGSMMLYGAGKSIMKDGGK